MTACTPRRGSSRVLFFIYYWMKWLSPEIKINKKRQQKRIFIVCTFYIPSNLFISITVDTTKSSVCYSNLNNSRMCSSSYERNKGKWEWQKETERARERERDAIISHFAYCADGDDDDEYIGSTHCNCTRHQFKTWRNIMLQCKNINRKINENIFFSFIIIQ